MIKMRGITDFVMNPENEPEIAEDSLDVMSDGDWGIKMCGILEGIMESENKVKFLDEDGELRYSAIREGEVFIICDEAVKLFYSLDKFGKLLSLTEQGEAIEGEIDKESVVYDIAKMKSMKKVPFK